MKSTYEVLRRTFEAAKHPEGSAERARLNCDALTSEYMPSYRYMLRWPAIMSDGTPNPAQKYFYNTYCTKHEAELAQYEKVACPLAGTPGGWQGDYNTRPMS